MAGYVFISSEPFRVGGSGTGLVVSGVKVRSRVMLVFYVPVNGVEKSLSKDLTVAIDTSVIVTLR